MFSINKTVRANAIIFLKESSYASVRPFVVLKPNHTLLNSSLAQ
jgi:hypothetical protein